MFTVTNRNDLKLTHAAFRSGNHALKKSLCCCILSIMSYSKFPRLLQLRPARLLNYFYAYVLTGYNKFAMLQDWCRISNDWYLFSVSDRVFWSLKLESLSSMTSRAHVLALAKTPGKTVLSLSLVKRLIHSRSRSFRAVLKLLDEAIQNRRSTSWPCPSF
jgi:hypothetical protein